MRRLLSLSLLTATPLASQQTTAERTNYAATSSHADVVAFLDSLQRLGAGIRIGRLGMSPMGRVLPYIIASRPLVDAPARAARSGKPIIYLQGNIHGGEVEGKEAALMLLRELTLGSLRPLLDSVVLVVVPLYNADGNDAFGPEARNRPAQQGPALIGQRANGQGLDLNRDYLKQEAPETRAAASLLVAWDPDLFIDLHTTDGSYHGYLLTYDWGLNPNSSPANDYVRDSFLPELRKRMRARHRQEVFSYGNFRNAEPDSLTQGWETYDARPRFGTNWMGMRGRLAILSEAYSHADFATRVSATYNFVLEILRLAAEERAAIKSLALASSRYRPDSVALRSGLAPPTPMDVIAEITERAGEGGGPFARRRPTGRFRTIRMPVFDRFQAERKEAIPAAYLFGPQHAEVAALLRSHGIEVRRLTAAWSAATEVFTLDSLIVEPLFEGHRTIRVEGKWGPGTSAMPPGWFMVPTDQPLGVLAAYLLEPASEDGLVTWNFFDRSLRRGQPAPVLRVRAPLNLPSELLP
ncbi:MAG TPA: M14 family metallopeptidase [Gemmatimonadales bacterium]|jgi:murein tripeptide amidase MpaA|nr:M14 family metallopeptidase [Gemmatimonadales bacterium]